MNYKILRPNFRDTYTLAMSDSVSVQLSAPSFTSSIRNLLCTKASNKSLALNACSNEYPNGMPIGSVRRPDFLPLYFVAGVFSVEAMKLITFFDAKADDFVVCSIAQFPGDDFYIFLPETKHDAIDVERSKFQWNIPACPPDIDEQFLVGIIELSLKPTAKDLPSCFLLKKPSKHLSEFSEIIVSNELSIAWQEKGLIGAEFD